MIVDDSIEFRFQTRTLSEDYRVFKGDGSEVGDYAEFAQFERIAQVKSDDETSAVVYEGVGRYYLAVFGLNRKSKDRAGREKRFSFCVSFNDTGIRERERAMRAFSGVINNWDGIGLLAEDLLVERPTTRTYDIVLDIKDEKTGETKKVKKTKTVPGENVNFDYGKFIRELVRLGQMRKPITPPEAGKMRKYFADTDETFDLGAEDEVDDSGEGYMRWGIAIAIAGLLCVGWLIVSSMLGNGQSKQPAESPEQPSNLQERQSSQPENSSGNSQSVKANKKEEVTNGGHKSDTENNGSGNTVNLGSTSNNSNSSNNDGIQGDKPGDNKPEAGGTQPQKTPTDEAKGEGNEVSE